MNAMTRDEFHSNYWNYYLMLEKEVLEALEYVELSTDNFSTYSNKFAALIRSIGSELDVFFKVYCDIPADAIKNIADYAQIIFIKYSNIVNEEVRIKGTDIVLRPFEGWDKDRAKQSLLWWESYDNVKHSRVACFDQASLKNCIYALAALYLIENKGFLEILKDTNEVDIMNEPSQLFAIKNWKTKYMSARDFAFAFESGKLEIVSVRKDGADV